MNFQQQAEQFLSSKADLRSNTIHAYRSLLNARILPAIGQVEMSDVDSATVKTLVGQLVAANLSPATIRLAVSLVKKIVSSAWDNRGKRLHKVDWNSEFIAAPEVEPSSQKAPIATVKALSGAVQATSGEVKALIALLAGAGLRIGEALSLKLEDWDQQVGLLRVHSTMVRGVIQDKTKTKAGTRVVDLHPTVNQIMRDNLDCANSGLLFTTGERTLRRRVAALGIEGFHSLRRFRITHLQSQNVPVTLTKFWAGHAAGDVTERYTKIGSQIQERKDWSEKAGLGFQL